MCGLEPSQGVGTCTPDAPCGHRPLLLGDGQVPGQQLQVPRHTAASEEAISGRWKSPSSRPPLGDPLSVHGHGISSRNSQRATQLPAAFKPDAGSSTDAELQTGGPPPGGTSETYLRLYSSL